MMKVKVIFGNDIRRWRYPQSQRYQNLLNFIKQTFNFLDERQFYVQFEDDEGDRLTLISETDFEDAFSCAEQEGRKSLKIFIMRGSIEDSHNNDHVINNNIDNLSSVSFSSPSVAPSRAQQLNYEKQQEQQSKPMNNQESHSEKKEEIKDKKDDEKCEESCQQNSCSQWRQLALDFLQNKEIQPLLPQFLRHLIASLRKEQQQTTSNQRSLLQIVNEILGEDQFKPIVKHEFYTQKIALMLPLIVERFQSHRHLLLAFNEDTIASWIPNLINVLTTPLLNFENVDLEIDVDPMFNQFFPLFPCMNDYSGNYNCSNENNEQTDPSAHSNVSCDNCQCCPITGIRYKCGVCDNYDLCSKCEALGTHDRSHPLLKMTCPVGYGADQQYNGLYEFLNLRPRRRRFHHPPFHPKGHHGSPHCRRRGPFAHGHRRRCHDINNNEAPNCCPPSNNDSNDNKRISAQFVNDVTIPEKSYSPVDTVMTKTWRVRNDGNVEWGNDTELVFFKGDESLVLEKRYPVSNAQPGEEIDISAIIKTPLKSGLYSAVFRLKKNDSFFGSDLRVELFAIEENDEVSESKLSEKHNIICVCGEPLAVIPCHQAYNGVRVFCNVCGQRCPSEEVIYHCQQNRSQAHPGGYDMCLNCVKIQMESLVPSNVNNDKDEQKNENNHVENGFKNDNDFFPIMPVNSVNVNEIANNNQSDNMSAKNSEPELIEMEDISDNENNKQNEKQQNEEDNFEFKSQLNSLKEMGFDNVETLKFLLIKHKGDVQLVIQELLQA